MRNGEISNLVSGGGTIIMAGDRGHSHGSLATTRVRRRINNEGAVCTVNTARSQINQRNTAAASAYGHVSVRNSTVFQQPQNHLGGGLEQLRPLTGDHSTISSTRELRGGISSYGPANRGQQQTRNHGETAGIYNDDIAARG